MQHKRKDTSWNQVANWYNKIVGRDGHYYHEHVVIPGVLRLLQLQPSDTLVDFACGQGILARRIPSIAKYLGLDLAKDLIQAAKQQNHQSHHEFMVCDLSKLLRPRQEKFDKAALILALQNIEHAQNVMHNAANYLKPGGRLVIVLNHPCFRIPRQSAWQVDQKTKQQQRVLNRYLSPLKIPIEMNPGSAREDSKKITWSFHHSLQEYSQMLKTAGFMIEQIEEWSSDKESTGKQAHMENRARSEFPLFLAISAQLRQ